MPLTNNVRKHVVIDTPQTTDAGTQQEEYWNCVSLFLIAGGTTLDDSELFDYLVRWNWSVCEKNGAVYALGPDFLHRIVLGTGRRVQVDHRNGDGLDNRRSNLRPCNHRQNQWNSSGKRRGKSRYKGVVLTKWGWHAQIRCGDKRPYLGVFATEEEAARVYDAAARRLHGEFAKLNFPGDEAEPVTRNPMLS
jgi:hypothetical protein